MKKLNIFLMMIFVITLLSGCNDSKNEFKDVSRITYTSNGVTNTVYPSWYLIRGNMETSAEEEYESSKYKASVIAPANVTVSSIEFYTSDLFSGNIHVGSEKPYKPFGISEQDIGDYFYIYAHDLGHYSKSYFKTEIKNVGSILIKIKIIDSTTIVIKRGEIETTYTVTSYSFIE